MRDDFVSISQLATRVYMSVCSVSAVGSLCKADFLFSAHQTRSLHASRTCHLTNIFYSVNPSFSGNRRGHLYLRIYTDKGWDGGARVGQCTGQLVLVAYWFRLWDSNSNVTGLIPDSRTCELEHY